MRHNETLRPYEIDTITRLRQARPFDLAPYSDVEIARAFAEYSEMFHAAGWIGGHENDEDFLAWALRSPLQRYKGPRA